MSVNNTTGLTKRAYFRQGSLLVNAKFTLTSNEINVIITLLSAIDKDDKDFKEYVFSLKDFNVKTEKNMTSKDLRATVKSLMSKPLEIYKDENEWEVLHWISYFSYKRGVVTCSIHQKLKPYLLNLKQYVYADLKIVLSLKSMYSKRIYLLLKEYAKFGKRSFSVEQLQEILQVPKSCLMYDQLKKKVIERSVKEINEHTDIEISYKEVKRAKKVIVVVFHIRKNYADLRTFIGIIRELYVNTTLLYTKDDRPLKCSDKGYLYYGDTMENINKKNALELWGYLFENRKELACYENNNEE